MLGHVLIQSPKYGSSKKYPFKQEVQLVALYEQVEQFTEVSQSWQSSPTWKVSEGH